MDILLYQIDAFADRVFGGNPAAVCPLEDGLDARTMQAIAAENNLSETAFSCRAAKASRYAGSRRWRKSISPTTRRSPPPMSS